MFKNALKILRARTWEILGAFIAILALDFAFDTGYFGQQISIKTLPKLIVAATVFVACARSLLLNQTAKGSSLNRPRQPADGAPARIPFRVFIWVISLWFLALLASTAVGFTVYLNYYGFDLQSNPVEHLSLNSDFESEIKLGLFLTLINALFYGLVMALFGTKISAMAIGAEHGFRTTLRRGRQTFFFVISRLIIGPFMVRVLFTVGAIYFAALLWPLAITRYLSTSIAALGLVISTLLEGSIYAMALQRAEPDLKEPSPETQQSRTP